MSGLVFDHEGLHWRPLRFFPWVEHSFGFREVRPNVLRQRHWYRWHPAVLEETEDANGEVFQTIRLADGREQVRCAPWRARTALSGKGEAS